MDWLGASRRQLEDLDASPFRDLGEESAEGEPYGRALLAESAEAELLLMRWAPGVACAPHDHADASGIVRVLWGELRETVFTRSDDSLDVALGRPLRAGDVVEFGRGHVHQMCAEGAAATLHVYRPRIRGMRVWDLDAGRLLVVDDAHGAFVPRDAARIVASRPWPPARLEPAVRGPATPQKP